MLAIATTANVRAAHSVYAAQCALGLAASGVPSDGLRVYHALVGGSSVRFHQMKLVASRDNELEYDMDLARCFALSHHTNISVLWSARSAIMYSILLTTAIARRHLRSFSRWMQMRTSTCSAASPKQPKDMSENPLAHLIGLTVMDQMKKSLRTQKRSRRTETINPPARRQHRRTRRSLPHMAQARRRRVASGSRSQALMVQKEVYNMTWSWYFISGSVTVRLALSDITNQAVVSKPGLQHKSSQVLKVHDWFSATIMSRSRYWAECRRSKNECPMWSVSESLGGLVYENITYYGNYYIFSKLVAIGRCEAAGYDTGRLRPSRTPHDPTCASMYLLSLYLSLFSGSIWDFSDAVGSPGNCEAAALWASWSASRVSTAENFSSMGPESGTNAWGDARAAGGTGVDALAWSRPSRYCTIEPYAGCRGPSGYRRFWIYMYDDEHQISILM